MFSKKFIAMVSPQSLEYLPSIISMKYLEYILVMDTLKGKSKVMASIHTYFCGENVPIAADIDGK